MGQHSTENGTSSSYPFSDEVPELLQKHLDHLKASAISIDVIRERGYESVLGKKRLADLGFSKAQQRTPGILIPLYSPDGSRISYQYRPDNPRTNTNGKLIRYENQPGSSIHLDVPPRCRPMLGDPKVPIFFVEGIKKADSLASQGACAVALNGVWGFKGKNPLGGTTILADFDYITLKGRDSYVVYDSDYATIPQVGQAQNRLVEHLKRKGANAKAVYLPPKSNGEKQAADDFLAAGHSIDDIIELGIVPEQKPKLKGGYRVEDGCICRVKIESGGLENIQPLCNFTAKVVQDIRVDDGVEQQHFFAIEGQLANGFTMPRIQVPASSFSGLNWVVANWGVNAVIAAGLNAKDCLREAIQLMSQTANKRTVFTFTGWKEIDGQWFFLSAGTSKLDVELPPQLSRYRLPEACENPKEAVEASLRFLDVASLQITVPLLSATYGAPLGEANPFSLLLFLYGLTGGLKTSLACLAISHFGGPFTPTSVPITFESTENFIERLSSQAKDVLLLIDDLFPQPTEAKSRQQEQVVQRLIRGQSSHSGRGRLRPDTSPRPSYTPRGLIVATGEILPSGQSTHARTLVVDVSRDQVNLKMLSRSQAEADLYPYAMRSYLDWLSPQMSTLKQQLPKEVLKLREKVQQRDAHLKVGEMVAQLLAGWDMFLQHAKNVGAITEERQDELDRIGFDILLGLGRKQDERILEERPTTRFVSILKDLFAQKRAYLRDRYSNREPDEYEMWGWERRETDDGDKPTIHPAAELLGWIDDDYLYLLSEVSYRVVARFAREQGEPITTKKRTLQMQLRKVGILIPVDGQNIIPKKIAGNAHRVIQLNINGFAV